MLEQLTKIADCLHSVEELWNEYDSNRKKYVFGPCRPFSATFDGQSNLCEVMNLMIRLVINFKPISLCVRLSLLKCSQDSKQLARGKADPTACHKERRRRQHPEANIRVRAHWPPFTHV